MKKLFIVLLAAYVFAVVDPTKSEAIVRYDGAEVYKDQTGKMTFTKDIKVYKKNEDGTFDSLVVKNMMAKHFIKWSNIGYKQLIW